MLDPDIKRPAKKPTDPLTWIEVKGISGWAFAPLIGAWVLFMIYIILVPNR